MTDATHAPAYRGSTSLAANALLLSALGGAYHTKAPRRANQLTHKLRRALTTVTS